MNDDPIDECRRCGAALCGDERIEDLCPTCLAEQPPPWRGTFEAARARQPMTSRRHLGADTTADTVQLPLGLATEGQQVLAAARRRADLRARHEIPVDYDALNRMVRRQRATLTRAVHSGETDRIVLACRDAVHEWNQPGAMWPDDWTTWQAALDDTLPWNATVDLRDL